MKHLKYFESNTKGIIKGKVKKNTLVLIVRSLQDGGHLNLSY